MIKMNNCNFIGRVTKDIELRATKNGTNVCNIGLALMRKSKDEETTFLNIIAYNKTAELCRDYVKKGDLIAIDCYVKNNNWEDENKNKHWENQFIARQVYFISQNKSNGNNTPENIEKDVNLELNEKDLPF